MRAAFSETGVAALAAATMFCLHGKHRAPLISFPTPERSGGPARLKQFPIMDTQYRICRRCVMDTSDPAITFDADGICNHCTGYLANARRFLLPAAEREAALAKLVDEMREAGRGRDYDCIIGVSGGVDSSYVAWKVKELGLRPLAVHLDNGWNAELAVGNIKRLLERLGIDLYTVVLDWEEFRDAAARVPARRRAGLRDSRPTTRSSPRFTARRASTACATS